MSSDTVAAFDPAGSSAIPGVANASGVEVSFFGVSFFPKLLNLDILLSLVAGDAETGTDGKGAVPLLAFGVGKPPEFDDRDGGSGTDVLGPVF